MSKRARKNRNVQENVESGGQLWVRSIRTKTEKQREYLTAIDAHYITFSIGPAGTGKTFLACLQAAKYLAENKVERIILCRPAIEAGEKLGFLPGTLEEKLQ